MECMINFTSHCTDPWSRLVISRTPRWVHMCAGRECGISFGSALHRAHGPRRGVPYVCFWERAWVVNANMTYRKERSLETAWGSTMVMLHWQGLRLPRKRYRGYWHDFQSSHKSYICSFLSISLTVERLAEKAPDATSRAFYHKYITYEVGRRGLFFFIPFSISQYIYQKSAQYRSTCLQPYHRHNYT